MNDNETRINKIKEIVQSHDHFWDLQRSKLNQIKNTYAGDFWQDCDLLPSAEIRINTPYLHKFVESFISVLFLRQPGVIVLPSPVGINPSDQIQTLANYWLNTKRKPIENTTKSATMYPQSYTKMFPKANPKDTLDFLDVQITSILPWDVIIDRAAPDWKSMRYIGHRYPLPISEAKEKFEKIDFQTTQPVPFLQDQKDQAPEIISEELQFVEIIEFYDFKKDTVSFLSQDQADGWVILSDEKIPIRSETDTPLNPICALYFDYFPDQPLVGIPIVNQVWDQIVEVNVARTRRANIVAKQAQVNFIDAKIGDTQVNSVLDADDGTTVAIDTSQAGGQPLSQLFHTIRNTELSPEFDKAIAEIMGDLDRASNLPIQSQGDFTNATATEVGFVNGFAGNLIGRMAKEKSVLIEEIAYLFIRILASTLPPNTKINLVSEDKSGIIVSMEDLQGSFKYNATDGDTNPITQEAKKHQLIAQTPLLLSLGAPPEELLTEICHLWGWSDRFLQKKPVNSTNVPALSEPNSPLVSPTSPPV